MNENQVEKLSEIIVSKIKIFQNKYVNTDNLVLTNFINDYDSLFDIQITTHELIFQLKKDIKKKINNMIKDKTI